jgi:nanoRNase/pAp phosphatase (c-di-AMP/oligoRNAs hydrolase)
MLSRFNGGGHRGAGACNVKSEEAGEVIEKIKNILIENKNNE